VRRVAGLAKTLVSKDPDRTLLGLTAYPVRTILDVGANVGQFARMAATRFPDAHILCFEPQPQAFGRLAAWCATTNGRAEAFNTALGDRTGVADMVMHLDHDPSSSLLASTDLLPRLYPQTARQERKSVPLTTLDAFVAGRPGSLEPPVLVKLDVQGYEGRVIAGGAATLAQACAAIVEVSLDSLYAGQASFTELTRRLAAIGLSYAGSLEQRFAPDGHVIYSDVVYLRRGQLECCRTRGSRPQALGHEAE
jgi:FkbM family methyltransferase